MSSIQIDTISRVNGWKWVEIGNRKYRKCESGRLIRYKTWTPEISVNDIYLLPSGIRNVFRVMKVIKPFVTKKNYLAVFSERE